MTLSDQRLGEIIYACHLALRRADLDWRVRAQVRRILECAQARAREVMR